MANSYRVTIGGGQKDSRTLELETAPVEELTELLSEFEDGEKDGPSLIPAVFQDCPERCRAAHRIEHPCNGNGPHRIRENVTHVTMLGIDIDHASPEQIANVHSRLISRGLRYWCWNTHSHTAERPRIRILIPFKEEAAIKHYSHWANIAWPALMTDLGLMGLADSACKDPHRLYFLPRRPAGATGHAGFFIDGKEYDWRAVIGDGLEQMAAPEARTIETLGQEEDESRPVDLEALREKLRNLQKPESRALFRRVLSGDPITSSPDKRRPGEISRYEAWRTVTSTLSLVAEDWMSTDALLSLLRPSWNAEVAETPADHTDWDRVETLLVQARSGAAEQREQKKQREEAQKKAMARVMTKKRKPGPRPSEHRDAVSRDAAPAVVEEAEAEEEPDTSWVDKVEWQTAKEGEAPRLANKSHNITALALHHPEWKESLRVNELTRQIEVWGGPLLERAGEFSRTGREWDRTDEVHAADHFARKFKIEKGFEIVGRSLAAAAAECRYNPLREHLESLPAWDGEGRLETLFLRYFGARGVDDEGKDLTRYLAAIGKRWAISAIARAFEPGCKVDTMLTLEDQQQGTGKSTSLRILAGDEFFTDMPIDMDSRDSLMVLTRRWIIEFAEWSNMRKKDVDVQRGFLSRQTDSYREPYGSGILERPRHCLFAGTTNNVSDYLLDTEGNRRHWPVRTGKIDLEALRRDRSQIWAEAIALYHAGEQWHLTDEEAELAAPETEKRQVQEPIREAFVDWWKEQPIPRRPDHLKTHEVIKVLEEKGLRGIYSRQVAGMLKQLGFELRRVFEGEVKTRIYVVPQSFKDLPRSGPTTAQRVGAAKTMQVLPGGLEKKSESGA